MLSNVHCFALFILPLHNWLVSLSLTRKCWDEGMSVSNPCASCDNWPGGFGLTQFIGFTQSTFSPYLIFVGRKILALIKSTSPVLKPCQGGDIEFVT